MNPPNIAIVDYQAGNLRSVQKALEKYGAQAIITSKATDLDEADALVFPGQGANDSSMLQLKSMGFVSAIKKFVTSGRPFLGVCLGLQLLLDGSEEGIEPGIGILEGRCLRLPQGFKVPHMGWNKVNFHIDHPVLYGMKNGMYFYFVHSYYAKPKDDMVIAGTTTYGIEFCSVAAKQNVVAVQFHPEKSGTDGLQLYKNFVELASNH